MGKGSANDTGVLPGAAPAFKAKARVGSINLQVLPFLSRFPLRPGIFNICNASSLPKFCSTFALGCTPWLWARTVPFFSQGSKAVVIKCHAGIRCLAMEPRRAVTDWLIVIAGALLLIAVVLLVRCGVLGSELAQMIVLALTAWVILWYTVETMRLRREAEARAQRDLEPRIHFDLDRFPLSTTGNQSRFFFDFANESSNSALARVTLRMKTASAEIVTSPRAGYDGKQTWEVTPFFRIRGWFTLDDFWDAVGNVAGWAGLVGDQVLNVQVDVYWPSRNYLITLKREYRVHRVSHQVEFWPEVATVIPDLPHPKRLT